MFNTIMAIALALISIGTIAGTNAAGNLYNEEKRGSVVKSFEIMAVAHGAGVILAIFGLGVLA